MKSLSVVALLAALAVPTLAAAQDVSVSASGEISVSASASVSVSTPDPSSAISSVSSELSSALSSVSSELSSALSSESSAESSASMSSGVVNNCDDLDIATMVLTPIDAAVLAAVTSVTVFSVNDCTGLGDLATLDATALAAIGTNQIVVDALAAAGESGAEIIAYTLDGASLTVYVRDRA